MSLRLFIVLVDRRMLARASLALVLANMRYWATIATAVRTHA